MKIEDRIAYYVTEAERRLVNLALPTDPAGRLEAVLEKYRTDEKLKKLYLGGTISCLYATISAAHRALAAYRVGDWDGFAEHFETMIGQSMGARIPDLVSHQQKQKAKKQRAGKQSNVKSRAKGIFEADRSVTIDGLGKKLQDDGVRKMPVRSTLAAWLKKWKTEEEKSD